MQVKRCVSHPNKPVVLLILEKNDGHESSLICIDCEKKDIARRIEIQGNPNSILCVNDRIVLGDYHKGLACYYEDDSLPIWAIDFPGVLAAKQFSASSVILETHKDGIFILDIENGELEQYNANATQFFAAPDLSRFMVFDGTLKEISILDGDHSLITSTTINTFAILDAVFLNSVVVLAYATGPIACLRYSDGSIIWRKTGHCFNSYPLFANESGEILSVMRDFNGDARDVVAKIDPLNGEMTCFEFSSKLGEACFAFDGSFLFSSNLGIINLLNFQVNSDFLQSL